MNSAKCAREAPIDVALRKIYSEAEPACFQERSLNVSPENVRCLYDLIDKQIHIVREGR